MIRCYLCGRSLLRAAATVETRDGTGYAGPTCGRKVGLLPPVVHHPRRASSGKRGRRRDKRQFEIVA